MDNATSSTVASHADPYGRLHGPRRLQRRLHDHARTLGFADPASYLQARCQQPASPAQLASELATTPTVVRHLLQQAGLAPPPRQVTAAHKRRATTDQHLAARAAELGFATPGTDGMPMTPCDSVRYLDVRA